MRLAVIFNLLSTLINNVGNTLGVSDLHTSTPSITGEGDFTFLCLYQSFLLIFIIISISLVVGIYNICLFLSYISDLPNTTTTLLPFVLLGFAIASEVSGLVCVTGWFGLSTSVVTSLCL